ncbi:MAG: hypothetical protein QXV21_00530, partial [Candidatus Bathyarchaeia archaeon]
QRWLCRNCGYRFTDPRLKRHNQWKNPPFSLNLSSGLFYSCQGNNDPDGRGPSALEAVQTLAEVSQKEKQAAGATIKTSETELYGKIVEFLFWMKKQGYKEATILGKGKRLSRLVKLGADLLNPESVKEVIAAQSWKDSSKETTVHAYESFLKWVGLKWEKPIYKASRKLPFYTA